MFPLLFRRRVHCREDAADSDFFRGAVAAAISESDDSSAQSSIAGWLHRYSQEGLA